MHVSIFEFKYLKIKKIGLVFASSKVKTLKVTRLTATFRNDNWMSIWEFIRKFSVGYGWKNNNTVWNSRDKFQIKHLSATSIGTRWFDSVKLTPWCRYGAIALFNHSASDKRTNLENESIIMYIITTKNFNSY